MNHYLLVFLSLLCLLPAQTVRVANYGSAYEGWVRATVDTRPPHAAGAVPGARYVLGRPIGDAWVIDLQLKLAGEFPEYVADRIRAVLTSPDVTETSVVAVFGAGSLYGFTHVSEVLKGVERDVRGRLVVFFPGTLEQNNYRLLDARDGWNYMAVPISIHSAGGPS